tara:strand:+ start:273 stop:860 length:588 start_codon:yes stop_codon:yes gene_type:complete
MIVNDKTKELLIVPMKCGSTSFRKLYAKDKDWFDLSSNKQLDRLPLIGVEKIHEMFCITKRDIDQYSKTLIIRDPVQWLISGFRFLQLMNHPKSPWYPKHLAKHLNKVRKDKHKDLFFTDHCCALPNRYYFPGCKIIKLEESNLSIQENVTPSRIAYPELDESAIQLIVQLTEDYCELFGYDIEKSIKYYMEEIL